MPAGAILLKRTNFASGSVGGLSLIPSQEFFSLQTSVSQSQRRSALKILHTVARVLQLDSRDNVLVALGNLKQGETIECGGSKITLHSNVPAKHKFSTKDLPAGATITMYGVLVGTTTLPVHHGELLTTKNVHHAAAEYSVKSRTYQWRAPDVSRWKKRRFGGYIRSDGQVGTRNYWLVVPLVFCENRNIEVLKQAFEQELGYAAPKIYNRQVAELARLYRESRHQEIAQYQPARDSAPSGSHIFKNIDGIKFLMHQSGCGGTREDSGNLCGLIAGYLHHPNVAGATILSLGCQHSQVNILRDEILRRDPGFSKPLLIFEQQQSDSEFSMLSEAIRKTFLGMVEADQNERTPAPLSKLCIGLKCGGSDGFSGLSANPAIGHVSDVIAALGGRTILSEFP